MNYNPNPYHQLYNRCLIASVLCYILSFIFPVYSADAHWIEWHQGLRMLLLGWVTLFEKGGAPILFFIWLANPIYHFILLFCLIKHFRKQGNDFTTTLGSRIIAYLPFFLGLSFLLIDKILEDDGKGLKPVETFHIGYWLWFSSFILLAIGFMARSEENSAAHKAITFYFKKTQRISSLKKTFLAIGILIILETIAYLSGVNPIGEKDALTGKTFEGYYLSCQRISISFNRDNIALARISSTDFVGHFTEKFHGTYTYDSSKTVIDWGENEVDMEYAVYDSIKHELTLYGGKEKHVLKEDL